MCPTIPLFFLGLNMLTGISAKREAVFFGTQKKSGICRHLKEKRYSWAPKREAVFDPRAPKLVGPKKKSGVFGHPKEKRYLIREPLSYSGPKRKAVFLEPKPLLH
jgi:hypothetical protein